MHWRNENLEEPQKILPETGHEAQHQGGTGGQLPRVPSAAIKRIDRVMHRVFAKSLLMWLRTRTGARARMPSFPQHNNCASFAAVERAQIATVQS